MYPVHGRCTFELWQLLFLHRDADELPCRVRAMLLSATATALAAAALALAASALALATTSLALTTAAALAATAALTLTKL